MIPPPVFLDEEQRLQVLQQYAVLDTPPERALDDLTRTRGTYLRSTDGLDLAD